MTEPMDDVEPEPVRRRRKALDFLNTAFRNVGPPALDGFDLLDIGAAIEDIEAAAIAALTPRLSAAKEEGWRPIETAPKDGTRILALLERPDHGAVAHLKGRIFEVRHEGVTPGGYDMGWSLYPGYGGVPDRWFAGWMPSPAAINNETSHG